jgi:isoamylase
MSICPGDAYPLRAKRHGTGTNFALFSEVADRVELCLFDPAGDETRVALTEVDIYTWHGSVPGVGPGQHYGYFFMATDTHQAGSFPALRSSRRPG